jgi:hypothetical protein
VTPTEVYRFKGTLLLQLSIPAIIQGGLFQAGAQRGPRPAGYIFRVTGGHESESVVAAEGTPEAARSLLAPIYAWFIEGFDTSDLQEAKVLLTELA